MWRWHWIGTAVFLAAGCSDRVLIDECALGGLCNGTDLAGRDSSKTSPPADLAAAAWCPGHKLGFAAADYSANGDLESVVIGDLNGDGMPDLVVTSFSRDGVSVLLGRGKGTFAAGVRYQAGTSPDSVAIADLNGDGRPDLAVANWKSHNVSVLLGAGDGTFAAAVGYSAGIIPRSIALADLNGDGKQDIAVAIGGDPLGNNAALSVLLNIGNGTFAAAVQYPTGRLPRSIALADLNGDGKPDVALGNSISEVSVLLGRGDGTFGGAVGYGVGPGPTSVALGDVNGDGRIDLAVADENGKDASMLLGNGDGTFKPAIRQSSGTTPYSVAIGDLDGDGKADLAVANGGVNNADGSVSVLAGKGDGTFVVVVSFDYAIGSYPRALALGDLDGDGKPDLAVANGGAGNVTVLLNTCM